MLNIIFVILCILVIYHHIIYPLILKLKKPKSPVNILTTPKHHPSITIIVPAYNEEKYIEQKIINLTDIIYPFQQLEIIVAFDGCTDNTVELARRALAKCRVKNQCIKLLDLQENRGKIAVLNKIIATSKSEIIALSDVSALLPRDCLVRLAANFEDEKIGTVGGSYDFEKTENDNVEQVYWKYQRAIKIGEASFGAPLGMHGAFYAFRRAYFTLLAPDTINDDFILPMSIVAQGYKAVYDTKIITIEKEHSTAEMNWNRRVRISAGNIQQSMRMWKLLRPKFGGIAFSFFSGKFLRAWMPLILIFIFLISIILAQKSNIFQAIFIFEICCILIVFIPASGDNFVFKALRILRYLTIGYAAGFIGMMRYLAGFENGKWARAHS